jgi:glyoxylase-like metal-dependent hydrolase (beta-lactamase superfamily II)
MDRDQTLAQSDSMQPVEGTIEVDIPAAALWECFQHPDWWPRWNKCFFYVRNRELVLGRRLVWAFQPIRWYFLYKMFAVANIVVFEPRERVTWEVTALPGFYARHTYHVEDLGNGRSRFGSYEKAMGWSFELTKWFWLKHFTFVKEESLAGVKLLEDIYKKDGTLGSDNLPPKRYAGFIVVTLLLLLVLGVLGACAWMYLAFGRPIHIALAPDVEAVLGGGGNSVLVGNAGDAILIDTKFGLGATAMQHWIANERQVLVTRVINTHYHYDHTRGNTLYPGAHIVAYKDVPQFMCAQPVDATWCTSHPTALPTVLVQESNRDLGSAMTLHVGSLELKVFHLPIAHTHGDVCVVLPKLDIVVLGDIAFIDYYPFIDTSPTRGASLSGTVSILRSLADEFPNATFVPGHGPLVRARALRGYADYLEDLNAQVYQAYHSGMSEAEAARVVDLRRWHRKILPSFPEGRILPEWATADRNIRDAYRLIRDSGNGPDKN